jgi:hypothetical protein
VPLVPHACPSRLSSPAALAAIAPLAPWAARVQFDVAALALEPRVFVPTRRRSVGRDARASDGGGEGAVPSDGGGAYAWSLGVRCSGVRLHITPPAADSPAAPSGRVGEGASLEQPARAVAGSVVPSNTDESAAPETQPGSPLDRAAQLLACMVGGGSQWSLPASLASLPIATALAFGTTRGTEGARRGGESGTAAVDGSTPNASTAGNDAVRPLLELRLGRALAALLAWLPLRAHVAFHDVDARLPGGVHLRCAGYAGCVMVHASSGGSGEEDDGEEAGQGGGRSPAAAGGAVAARAEVPVVRLLVTADVAPVAAQGGAATDGLSLSAPLPLLAELVGAPQGPSTLGGGVDSQAVLSLRGCLASLRCGISNGPERATGAWADGQAAPPAVPTAAPLLCALDATVDVDHVALRPCLVRAAEAVADSCVPPSVDFTRCFCASARAGQLHRHCAHQAATRCGRTNAGLRGGRLSHGATTPRSRRRGRRRHAIIARRGRGRAWAGRRNARRGAGCGLHRGRRHAARQCGACLRGLPPRIESCRGRCRSARATRRPSRCGGLCGCRAVNIVRHRGARGRQRAVNWATVTAGHVAVACSGAFRRARH